MSAPPTPGFTSAALVDWALRFAGEEIRPDAARQLDLILLDTLACALGATREGNAALVMRVVERLGGAPLCTLPGSRLRTSLPLATLATGTLIRDLDLNDTYYGPRQSGHPSEIIGAALAAAEIAGASGADLRRAIRLGYEVYGRLLDLADPGSAWDHVSVAGIATAVMTGWLLRLPPAALAHAVDLAATHSATLGEVRSGRVSGAKSVASSMVSHTAAMLTLLAAEGLTGPGAALAGERGFARLVLDGADIARLVAMEGPDRLLSVGLKPFPGFSLGQGPMMAAVRLRQQTDVAASRAIRLAVADTGRARMRVSPGPGQVPQTAEEADHSLHVLVALALLDGEVSQHQIEARRWRDPDVAGLIARLEIAIDPALTPVRDLPCRLEATGPDGRVVSVSLPATPGSPQNPLSRQEVEVKFLRYSADVLPPARQRDLLGLLETLETAPGVGPLLACLACP